MKTYYSINDFCEAYRIGRVALNRLWKEGDGPRRVRRKGRGVVITAEAAKEWWARRRDNTQLITQAEAKRPAAAGCEHPMATLAARLTPIDEAAKYLGVTRTMLDSWRVRGGGPPFIQVGVKKKKILYDRADLDAWLDNNVQRLAAEDAEKLAARPLTTTEAAKYLGVPRTVLDTWRFRGSGGPRFIQDGPKLKVLYDRGDLDTWRDNNPVKASTPAPQPVERDADGVASYCPPCAAADSQQPAKHASQPPVAARLTVAETAKYLRMSRTALHHLRDKGGGPRFFQLGPKMRILYDRADLDAWVDQHRGP